MRRDTESVQPRMQKVLIHIIICSTIFKITQVRTPFNCLLMNVIVAEFVSAAFGVPMDFHASWSHGWALGDPACVFTGFTLTHTGMAVAQTVDICHIGS